MGDSIVNQMSLGAPNKASLKLPPSNTSTAWCTNLAVAGFDVGEATTQWYQSIHRGNTRTKWVFIQIGINDVVHGQLSATQILAALAILISDIQTTTPSASIHLAKMDPAKTYLGTIGADRYQRYLDVEAGKLANWPSIYNTTIHDALSDGNDDLQTTYGGAGVLHPNTTGDAKAVDTLVTWLNALPGGWT